MGVNLGKPLWLGDHDADQFLQGLQGNILRSHRRNEAFHLFLCFGSPANDSEHKNCVRNAQEWISTLLNRGDITSALDEKTSAAPAGTFQSLLLTAEGYAFLGKKRPTDGAFRDGMRDRRSRLNDPDPTTWQREYRYEDNGRQVHALLIVADNDVANLELKHASISSELAGLGFEVLVSERGSQKRNANGKPIEHFGYRDGVSQPRLIIEAGEDAGTLPPGAKFDQRMDLKRVLVEDRLAKDTYGSYFVYRKLEQDVDGFNNAVKSVAEQIGQSEDYVGAQAVGRFKNGTALAVSGTEDPDFQTSGEGKFDYDDDRDGDRCPLHAHIRKVNPRNSLKGLAGFLAREKERRIARRGITYSEPSGRVGLIFMCYQDDIKDNFEFIQRTWANNNSFSKRGVGLDAIIGQDGGPQGSKDHPNWTTAYGTGERQRVFFGEHVKLRGGEYFYAPSMEGLKKLAD